MDWATGLLFSVFFYKKSFFMIKEAMTSNLGVGQSKQKSTFSDHFFRIWSSNRWTKLRKDQTKRMQPTGAFPNHPFKSYSSLKMVCLKMKFKNRNVFCLLICNFLISWLQLTVISERFKIRCSDWAHFLRLFEIFPGIIKNLNFQQCKSP
jgi:hypothetical protein